MADRSAIEWTDSTFNPWIGCTKVSPACDHCYAEVSTPSRTRGVEWGAGKPRQRTSAGNWKLPLRWNAEPFYTCGCGYRGTMHDLTTNAVHGCGLQFRRVRRRVFCASLADVFDNEVSPHWRAELVNLISNTPNLDWLLLTKRIGNAAAMLEQAIDNLSGGQCGWCDGRRFPHVWIGATICNQVEADRDIPKLLAVPAAVRFLSIEPMLGAIDVTEHLWGRAKPCADCPKDADCECGWYPRTASPEEPALGWIICGGESGPHARPMHPDWTRSLRDQCANAGVPFLFKQWGEWAPPNYVASNNLTESQILRAEQHFLQGDDGCAYQMLRVGKKAAGRLLDGATHDGYPEVVRADH